MSNLVLHNVDSKIKDKSKITNNKLMYYSLTFIISYFIMILSILPASLGTPYNVLTQNFYDTNCQWFTNTMFYIHKINFAYALYLALFSLLTFFISTKFGITSTLIDLVVLKQNKVIKKIEIIPILMIIFTSGVLGTLTVYWWSTLLFDSGYLGTLDNFIRGWGFYYGNGYLSPEETQKSLELFRVLLNLFILVYTYNLIKTIISKYDTSFLQISSRVIMFTLFFLIGLKFTSHSTNILRIFIPAVIGRIYGLPTDMIFASCAFTTHVLFIFGILFRDEIKTIFSKK